MNTYPERPPMFVIKDWQRLYAEALMETDPSKLPTKIMLAESSIAQAAIELCESSMPTEENHDLATALDELIAILRRLSPSMIVFGLPARLDDFDIADSGRMPRSRIRFA